MILPMVLPMVLYVTFDGLLQPLGRSQVTRYVDGLTQRGWRFVILSFERATDLADTNRVAELHAWFAARQIEWIPRTYQQGGARAVAANIAEGTAFALEIAADHDIALTHARSYLGAGVALAVQRTLGVPYLFDMRGYWVDERIEDGRWFTNPAALAVARRAERTMFQHSAAVVSLATPAADDIVAGRFGTWSKPVVVIPTCVDTDEFIPGPPPTNLAPELHDKLVIGYVGSLNASYRFRESFELAKHVLDLRDDAHLLCLTGQPDQVTRELDALRIPRLRRTITSVRHEEIPQWLRLIDWGLMLLHEPFAKRGSMPTKLAEFFATGIRPIAYGCNEDVVDWVRRAGSGIVLDSCTPSALRAAAEEIARRGKRLRGADPVGERAREITMPHFSAASGVERYDALYRALVCDESLRG